MKNIIFLVNIQNPHKPGRNDAYELSIDSWKYWANEHNCEVFVLTEPVTDLSEMNPILMRHYVFDLLEGSGVEYDQICMVDADTIVHPNCPNFFNLTNHQFSAVHNDGDYDWVIRSIENYDYEFTGHVNSSPTNLWKYFNTGFMITNKEYRWLHELVLNTYWDNKIKIKSLQGRYGVGTDQPLLNLIVRQNNVKVNLLPYQFNMQDLARKNVLDDRLLFTDIPGVYHFNAVPGGEKIVNEWMLKTYNHLYQC